MPGPGRIRAEQAEVASAARRQRCRRGGSIDYMTNSTAKGSSMSGTRAAPAPPLVLRPHLPLGVVVAIACLAQFMVVLDSTIVTVALPKMQAGLDLSVNQQQWVVSGYLIPLGGFLLLAARAGDLFGRKRVFLFGAVVFTAASLAGGLASDPAMLLAARIVQGTGAAALAPTSLSLITATHTDEHQRQRALALWSIMGGAAGLAGLVLGGVLTAELSWRWVLFVNIPLGAGLLVAAVFSLLPAPASTERLRLDLPGALSVTLGIGALTYGLSQASADGWGAPSVVTALVAAAALIAGFVAVEATSSRPLIPLALFRLRGLRIGNLLMLCMGVTMTAAFFFLSLYLQEALGYSALRTGLALLPTTVILIAGGLAARRLVPVAGPRLLLLAGGLITAASFAWLAGVPAHPAYLAHILGPALIAGVGLSLMLLPVTLTGTAGVDPKDAGAAAGLLNTSRQLGGAIGLAVLVTVAATVTARDARHATHLTALVQGYHVAFLADAGVMVVAALAALALPAAA
jgi:EmrB/QacA subfamily drug resistance transporter